MGRDRKNERAEQYVNVPYAILKSPAWRSLSGSSLKIYFELHARFNGGNNGKLHLSYAEASKAVGIGKATINRAFKELQDKGFIALEAEGNWYGRKAHEWRLTTKPMQGPKGKVTPTNDWRSWRPEKTKVGSNSDPSIGLVVPFQNPKSVCGSVSEPVRAKTKQALGSKSEH